RAVLLDRRRRLHREGGQRQGRDQLGDRRVQRDDGGRLVGRLARVVEAVVARAAEDGLVVVREVLVGGQAGPVVPAVEVGAHGLGVERRVVVERHALLEVERRSEEHTSELQSRENLVCRLLLEKKKKRITSAHKSVQVKN